MIKYCLFIILVLTGSFCHGQNQKVADSLIALYNSGSYTMDEFDLIDKIAANETDAQVSLKFAELLIQKAAKDSVFKKLYKGYLHKGNAYQLIGQQALALESFFMSQKFALRTGEENSLGSAKISIAGTYANMNNSSNATYYYKESIDLFRKLHDSIGLASALNNLGDLYITEEKLDSALILTQEASAIFNILDHTLGRAYSMGNT